MTDATELQAICGQCGGKGMRTVSREDSHDEEKCLPCNGTGCVRKPTLEARAWMQRVWSAATAWAKHVNSDDGYSEEQVQQAIGERERLTAELLPHLTQHPTDAKPTDPRAFVPSQWVADYFSRVVKLQEESPPMSTAALNARSRVLIAEALAELLPHLASVEADDGRGLSDHEAFLAERGRLTQSLARIQLVAEGADVDQCDSLSVAESAVWNLRAERDGLREQLKSVGQENDYLKQDSASLGRQT